MVLGADAVRDAAGRARLLGFVRPARRRVAARWAAYRVELKTRRDQIARVNAAAAAAAAAATQAAAAPAAAAPVQVVNLPAHVITRTS